MEAIVGAVDIGGTKIAVGLVNRAGQVLAQEQIATRAAARLEDGAAAIAGLLERQAAAAGVRLSGIGIGCTGRVTQSAGILPPNAFLPGWVGRGLLEQLESRLGVNAVIENDANAAALAECAWGAGRGARSLLYVTVSTGIGGGLVVDGQVYRGLNDAHPEIGHHAIDPEGPVCHCGARGCWEAIASGTALAAWLARQDPAAALDLPDAAAICRAAVQGRPLARLAVEREARWLGLGLANCITLYAPEVIALGGGVMQSYALFEDGIRQTIAAQSRLVPSGLVSLRQAQCGEHTGLLGAAQVWFAQA